MIPGLQLIHQIFNSMLNGPIPTLVPAGLPLNIGQSGTLELAVPHPLPLADAPLEVAHTRVRTDVDLCVVSPLMKAEDGFADGGGAAEPLASHAGGEVDLLGQGTSDQS